MINIWLRQLTSAEIIDLLTKGAFLCSFDKVQVTLDNLGQYLSEFNNPNQASASPPNNEILEEKKEKEEDDMKNNKRRRTNTGPVSSGGNSNSSEERGRKNKSSGNNKMEILNVNILAGPFKSKSEKTSKINSIRKKFWHFNNKPGVTKKKYYVEERENNFVLFSTRIENENLITDALKDVKFVKFVPNSEIRLFGFDSSTSASEFSNKLKRNNNSVLETKIISLKKK